MTVWVCGCGCGWVGVWGGLGVGVCRRHCHQKAVAGMVLHTGECKPGGVCVSKRPLCVVCCAPGAVGQGPQDGAVSVQGCLGDALPFRLLVQFSQRPRVCGCGCGCVALGCVSVCVCGCVRECVWGGHHIIEEDLPTGLWAG